MNFQKKFHRKDHIFYRSENQHCKKAKLKIQMSEIQELESCLTLN